MRIISGSARGRRLREPEDMKVRPTTDQVKEAMFNIVQFDVEGRRVLDLFAGTGQLGIEALSRGARECVFVDESRQSVALVRENLKRSELPGGKVLQAESLHYLGQGGKFDLIFLDPPYDLDLAEKALRRIMEFDILTEGGIIICETRRETQLPEAAAPYRFGKEYRYGKVKLTTYFREG